MARSLLTCPVCLLGFEFFAGTFRQDEKGSTYSSSLFLSGRGFYELYKSSVSEITVIHLPLSLLRLAESSSPKAYSISAPSAVSGARASFNIASSVLGEAAGDGAAVASGVGAGAGA